MKLWQWHHSIIYIALSFIVLPHWAVAEDYYMFSSYQRADQEQCIECEKTLGLAKEMQQVVDTMIEEKKVTGEDLTLANQKLQGLIAISEDVAKKQKAQEDCPSLASYTQVLPPTRGPDKKSLKLSQEIPFSQLKSFGFRNDYGERYYLKGHDGGKEILVEVQVIGGGKVSVNYYDYPHRELQEKYNLPDLGSSKAMKKDEKKGLIPDKIGGSDRDFFDGTISTKSELSLKKSEASFTAKVNPLDSKTSVTLDKKGVPTLALAKESEYYTIEYRQRYENLHQEEKLPNKESLRLSSPKTNTSATISRKGELESQVELVQKLNFFENDIVLSTEVKEKKSKQTTTKAVEITRGKQKLIKAKIDSEDNYSVTVPTQFTVGQENQLTLSGENTFGSKENSYTYTASLGKRELATYSLQQKRDSSLTRQSVSHNFVDDQQNGKLGIKVEEVKGATAADKELNQTTMWLTFEKKF